MNAIKLKQTAGFVVQGFNHLLWPAVCDSCAEAISEADKFLCKKCWDELLLCTTGDYCPRCGRDASKYALVQGIADRPLRGRRAVHCANCQDKPICFDGIARGGVYSGALRKMILAFKGADRTELDRHLCFLAEAALQGAAFFGDIEFFVPVPLHWMRRVLRGYNHSWLIAKKLAHPSARLSTDLVRIRYTKAQTTLSRAGRAANVAGAFAVRRDHKFSGRCVCLVDDIKTTGATLNECARTLKQAGAERVYALVLAVAGQSTS